MNLRMESFMKYIRFEKSGVCHVNSVDHYNATEFNGVKVSYDEYLDIQRFGGNDRDGLQYASTMVEAVLIVKDR